MPLQATSGAASYDAFGGGVVAEPNYIESVFSTYPYTANGSTQTITNGIDLSTKGGLVWIKARNTADTFNCLFDTNRGATKALFSNVAFAQGTYADSLTSFNTNGFSLGADGTTNFVNFPSGQTEVSWTFRKQPKFFDVVTYTGTGSARTVAHNLGSTPGCIIVKRTDAAIGWPVYHRGLTSLDFLLLDATSASSTAGSFWDDTNPTSTNFTVGSSNYTNASGGTYVAYLFAHNAGGFGLTGTDNVISCGTFTTNGSGLATVNLGYEPQWLLMKATDASNWWMFDNMRNWSKTGFDELNPNLSAGESNYTSTNFSPTATGFQFFGNEYGASRTFIYIAIRRGPMKVPTDGTSVFYPNAVAQSNIPDSSNVPFPPDLVNSFSRNGTDRTSIYDQFQFVDRLRGIGTPSNTYTAGGASLVSSSTNAENTSTSSYVQLMADSRNVTRGAGWNVGDFGNWIYYFWRRAPSFFDEVCYTGNSASSRTIAHNLGVAPEIIILKRRNQNNNFWWVYQSSLTAGDVLSLSETNATTSNTSIFTTTPPTSSVFSVGGDSGVNSSAGTYVAYLFATCAGVSKVTSFTGNGSSQTINCGFTGGARLVLIKRTDSTGDWYIWDSARGIVSGNDPHLSLNSTAAEVTTDDTIDTDSTGFIVNQVSATNCNVNGANYIVLAVA